MLRMRRLERRRDVLHGNYIEGRGRRPRCAGTGRRGNSPGSAICLAIAAQQVQPLGRGISIGTSVVDGNIFNSKGVHVGVVVGGEVFGLKGQKLYDLRGANIYKLNGDLVGHLSDARGAVKRLDKATDKLFPSTS
jgi:hypothetical protein